MKSTYLSTLIIFVITFGGMAQKNVPFQMPEANNKEAIYKDIDFYHFSTVAFDSKK